MLKSTEVIKEVNDNILNKYRLKFILDKLSADQLKMVHDYLWTDVIRNSVKLLGQSVDHQYLMDLMEPVEAFQRRNNCKESPSKCQQNFCVKTSPECASIKLKEQIEVLAGIFERRRHRTIDRTKSLNNYLKFFVERHQLLEAHLVTSGQQIITSFAMSQSENLKTKNIILNSVLNKLSPIGDDLSGQKVELVVSQISVMPEVKLLFIRLYSSQTFIDHSKIKSDILRIYKDPKLIVST